MRLFVFFSLLVTYENSSGNTGGGGGGGGGGLNLSTACARTIVTGFAIATAAFSVGVDAAANKDAPIHRAAAPILDDQGRKEYIVSFDFDADSKKPEDAEFADRASDADEKKWDKHRGKTINLLNAYEKKYGFTRNGMTSWASTSATAFLTDKQVAQLAKDKRVTLLTENAYETLSSYVPPPGGQHDC